MPQLLYGPKVHGWRVHREEGDRRGEAFELGAPDILELAEKECYRQTCTAVISASEM